MGSRIKVALFCLAGMVSGALLVSLSVYLFPYPHTFRTDRVLADFGVSCEGERISFFLDIPESVVAATHGGAFPFRPFPAGMPLLGESSLESGLAIITKILDGDGRVIGFATELETVSRQSSLLRGRIMTDTYWSLILPGRGSIHLYQTENNWKLVKTVALPVMISGNTWSGSWTNVNTLGPLPGGRGRIVGGSGDFRGITGSFIEIGTLERYSPQGDLVGRMELRLCYRLP
jgi:hypothetical protein